LQRSTDIYEQNSACLDGITMMRGMAEIQRRAETINLVDKAKTGMELYSIRIAWQIRQWALDYAQRDYGRVKFADQVTFAINAVGAAVLKMAGATPMHVFIVAQGLTLREKNGRAPRITQFLTMSKYRCMNLTTGIVVTPQAEMCIESIINTSDERTIFNLFQ